MIGSRYARVVLLPLILGAAAVHLAAQGPGNSLFTDPARRFAVEFPRDWTWMMVAVSGEPLVVFVAPQKLAVGFRQPRAKLPHPVVEESRGFHGRRA